MTKILITGGSGFIGRNLAEYLKTKESKYDVFSPAHTELDILDMDSLDKYIAEHGIEVVVHCANVGGTRKSSAGNILYKNLKMFFNLAKCADKLTKLVILGSGAEYDKKHMPPKASEKDFGKYIPDDEYGFSKYIMSRYIENHDKILNLRLFGVFGKYEDYEYKFISNAIVRNLLQLPIEIQQNVYFDYLYIDDCVRVIEWFIDNSSINGFYNLTAGDVNDLYTISEIINSCGDFKSEIKILHPGLNTEYSADNIKLKQQLPGISFTPLKASIPLLYEYYRHSAGLINKDIIIRDPYSKYCNTKNI